MNSPRVTNHLANERTFLAWLRTAISMMGFGVVIVRLRTLAPGASVARGHLQATQLGLLFSMIGLGMVVFALWNFFAVRRAIDADDYRSSGGGIVVFAVSILVLGIVAVIYLLNNSSAISGIAPLP